MEFEIIEIKKKKQRLLIEIEISETRERKHYGYPLGEGWEAETNGEPKFLKDIKSKLKDEEFVESQDLDLEKIKKSFVGKKIKVQND